jgi:hypothetical protein
VDLGPSKADVTIQSFSELKTLLKKKKQ